MPCRRLLPALGRPQPPIFPSFDPGPGKDMGLPIRDRRAPEEQDHEDEGAQDQERMHKASSRRYAKPSSSEVNRNVSEILTVRTECTRLREV